MPKVRSATSVIEKDAITIEAKADAAVELVAQGDTAEEAVAATNEPIRR